MLRHVACVKSKDLVGHVLHVNHLPELLAEAHGDRAVQHGDQNFLRFAAEPDRVITMSECVLWLPVNAVVVA